MEILILRKLPPTFSGFFLLLHLALFSFGIYVYFLLGLNFGLKFILIGILGIMIGTIMYYFVDKFMMAKIELEEKRFVITEDYIKRIFNEYTGYWGIAIIFYVLFLILILFIF